MEIPYIVTPRKDTGLFNSKIAIWLFLASEVMLFGGFFSAYVFLRLGADFPWPERTLPVLPGLINTFVLIASSVTVVFAWASLKLRQWGKFQIYMAITVICSFIFMGLKGIEYNVKFHHQALRTKDYSVVEGHLGYQPKDGVHPHHGEELKEEDIALNHKGKKIEQNVINFEATQITFNTVRYHKPWVEEMIAHAAEEKATIKLASKLELQTAPGQVVVFEAGRPLDLKLLAEIQQAHLAARKNNSNLRTASLREEWDKAFEANPDKKGWELADKVVVNQEAIKDRLMPEQPAVTFNVEPATEFHFAPRDVQETPGAGNLRDGTVVTGKLLASPMGFHYVDALDFRHLALKVREKLGRVDEETAEAAIEKAIEESWLLKENHELAEIWEKQQKALGQLTAALAAKGRVPTEKDKYRINWDEMAYYGSTSLADVKIEEGAYAMPKVEKKLKEEFFGPDYQGREKDHAFPHLEVPRDQVQFASKFAPAWNTYYAIYFTMTGLHGLHVIGGAIVLAYYLLFGKSMYLTNPEWLANRVEVGGLFWHFVDLVWIFLFPILYLM